MTSIADDALFVKIMASLRIADTTLSEQMTAMCMLQSVHMCDRKLPCTIPNNRTMHVCMHACYMHACYIHPSIHPSIHTYIHTYIHTQTGVKTRFINFCLQNIVITVLHIFISTKFDLTCISLYHLSCFGKVVEFSLMGFGRSHAFGEGNNISHLTAQFVFAIKFIEMMVWQRKYRMHNKFIAHRMPPRIKFKLGDHLSVTPVKLMLRLLNMPVRET